MRRNITTSVFLIISFCIWPALLQAQSSVPAIAEYINCRNTSYNNALDPRPLAPDWILKSNLKCRNMNAFVTSTSKLTQDEFNTHWRAAGGPEIMESALSKLDKGRHFKRVPEHIHNKFLKYTQGSGTFAKLKKTTPIDQIQRNLEKIDIFTNQNATTFLAITFKPYAPEYVFLLEVMLKRSFLENGEIKLPSELEEILNFRNENRLGSIHIETLRLSKNYITLAVLTDEQINKLSPAIVSQIKREISDKDRMTFLCPDLLKYVSSKYSLFSIPVDATPQCTTWYDEVSDKAAASLENIRDNFLANQRQLRPQIKELID
jgi:hypothetical protein